ncbi:MAG: hypothetical protein HFG62_13290 [Lachnospiraceae bacterium]|jgi:hypothetical protein|nr:hypothetical protein [Lachnospiraceae bacterium]
MEAFRRRVGIAIVFLCMVIIGSIIWYCLDRDTPRRVHDGTLVFERKAEWIRLPLPDERPCLEVSA